MNKIKSIIKKGKNAEVFIEGIEKPFYIRINAQKNTNMFKLSLKDLIEQTETSNILINAELAKFIDFKTLEGGTL